MTIILTLHAEKFFYDRLVSYMCSGPISPMILAHPDAIQRWRALMGPTKSHVARATAPHTIRGMFGVSDTRNSTHGSGTTTIHITVGLVHTCVIFYT